MSVAKDDLLLQALHRGSRSAPEASGESGYCKYRAATETLDGRSDPPDAHCTILRPMNVPVTFERVALEEGE
jgi:hypothetical protein